MRKQSKQSCGQNISKHNGMLLLWTLCVDQAMNINHLFSSINCLELHNEPGGKDVMRLTGPKPPPLVTYSGCFFKSKRSICCRGVWLVDSLQGSDSTYTHTKDKKDMMCHVAFLSCCLVNYQTSAVLLYVSLPVYRRFITMGSHLFEEGWVISQVLGHHIEAEKMTIDAFTSHGHSIELLVLFCCYLQKSQLLFSLNEENEILCRLNISHWLQCNNKGLRYKDSLARSFPLSLWEVMVRSVKGD